MSKEQMKVFMFKQKKQCRVNKCQVTSLYKLCSLRLGDGNNLE